MEDSLPRRKPRAGFVKVASPCLHVAGATDAGNDPKKNHPTAGFLYSGIP